MLLHDSSDGYETIIVIVNYIYNSIDSFEDF